MSRVPRCACFVSCSAFVVPPHHAHTTQAPGEHSPPPPTRAARTRAVSKQGSLAPLRPSASSRPPGSHAHCLPLRPGGSLGVLRACRCLLRARGRPGVRCGVRALENKLFRRASGLGPSGMRRGCVLAGFGLHMSGPGDLGKGRCRSLPDAHRPWVRAASALGWGSRHRVRYVRPELGRYLAERWHLPWNGRAAHCVPRRSGCFAVG